MTKIELPSYLDQSDAVRDRFARLKQRPVILEVKGLQKEFETPQGRITALNDIHFKTYKREFVCVIGPSGCGKSTLIRILAGLETKTSGHGTGRQGKIHGGVRGTTMDRPGGPEQI